MGQYTDKINQIAKDFAEIEYYEQVSSILVQTGCIITSYNHGGYKIQGGDRGGTYNMYIVEPGEVKIVPSTDEYYLKLKAKYGDDGDPPLTEKIAKWWKKIKKIRYFPTNLLK